MESFPMASVYVPQNTDCFLSESLSNSGVQYSRLHALSHVRFSENGEVSDSDDDDDDDDHPPFKKILAPSTRVQPPTRPPVIDLTCDGTDDDTWKLRVEFQPRRTRYLLRH
jgi:hypothetical protein